MRTSRLEIQRICDGILKFSLLYLPLAFIQNLECAATRFVFNFIWFDIVSIWSGLTLPRNNMNSSLYLWMLSHVIHSARILSIYVHVRAEHFNIERWESVIGLSRAFGEGVDDFHVWKCCSRVFERKIRIFFSWFSLILLPKSLKKFDSNLFTCFWGKSKRKFQRIF